MSYPVTRCILEHLEAHKRFRLAARCPAIKSVDRNIPLNMRNILFGDWKIVINNITFEFNIIKEEIEPAGLGADRCPSIVKEETEEILPGDILMNYNNRPRYSTLVEIISSMKGGTQSSRRLPEGIKLHMAMKMFTDHYFGRRKVIRTRVLNIVTLNQKVLRLPEGVQFYVQALGIGRHELDNIGPLLANSENLPIRSLYVHIWKPHYYTNPIILNANVLCLYGATKFHSYDEWIHIMVCTKNRAVQLEACLPEDKIRGIVKKIVDSGKDTTMFFSLQCSNKRFMENLVDKIKRQFNGRVVTCKGTINHKFPIITKIVSIPITSKTEIIAHGYQHFYEPDCFYFRLRAITIGRYLPVPGEQDNKRSGVSCKSWHLRIFICFIALTSLIIVLAWFKMFSKKFS